MSGKDKGATSSIPASLCHGIVDDEITDALSCGGECTLRHDAATYKKIEEQ